MQTGVPTEPYFLCTYSYLVTDCRQFNNGRSDGLDRTTLSEGLSQMPL